MALLVLTLAVVAGTAWRYLHGALTYLDNGDGLYLYPAWRLAQGARLYRDVMGTQPPLVFLLGAAVFKGGFGLTGIRLFSLTMRGLCVALVYLLGRRLFQGPVVAALAALLYALLPIGLTWDRTFNSNSPLTLVLLLSACALVRLTPRAARASGLLAALGLFTKDLYLPLLAVTVVYLALRQRRLLASYLQGVIGGVAAGGIALAMYAGPGALRDAFLGQASSPANPAWLVASLYYVVAAEGAVLLLALIGGLLCLRGKASVEANGPGGYTPYLLAGSAAVLVATLKEGTFGTVFALTEPCV